MNFRWFPPLATTFALVAAMLVAIPGPSPAEAAKNKPATPTKPGKAPAAPTEIIGPIDTQARTAMIVEADTGAVLLDKRGDQRIPPASMSKVMTAYLVFDYLKQGRAKLEDELPVSERAWRTGGSKMFVPLGKRVKIDDLLRGMIVQSGNDACVVLAEGLAGSEAAFVEQMNQKAREIGLTDSHFANVDGLPSPEHWVTARDLTTLALRTIKDFPEYYHYYKEKDYKFNTIGLNYTSVNINQGNRNPLLYKDLGADGLKTGHTEEAGYSLLASVKRGGRRIVVVLGGLPSMKARAQESERLVEWAFREYNNYRLFSAGAKVDDADVWLGVQSKVPLTIARDLVVTLPRKSRKDMKVTVVYDQPVPAPIGKGQPLGKIVVSAPNVAPVETPLQAAAEIDRLGAFGRMTMVAGHLVWGNRR
jgi:D-alanyl-D-alanine carboxypeptidase (penicillin-binding protein 5/6)